MFGSAPPQMNLKPLEQAAPTVSQSYGQDRASEGGPDAPEGADASAFGAPAPARPEGAQGFGRRPKKPWE